MSMWPCYQSPEESFGAWYTVDPFDDSPNCPVNWFSWWSDLVIMHNPCCPFAEYMIGPTSLMIYISLVYFKGWQVDLLTMKVSNLLLFRSIYCDNRPRENKITHVYYVILLHIWRGDGISSGKIGKKTFAEPLVMDAFVNVFNRC